MKDLSDNSSIKRKYNLKKEERLCSKKVIDKIFAEGKSILVFPLKIVFIKDPGELKSPVQVAFSVGKKNFKRAVHRNAIKRKMKEAYRLNKIPLWEVINDKQLAVFFIFIGKKLPDFKQLDTAMKRGIERVSKEINR
jgi:ribonuclease P protein component